MQETLNEAAARLDTIARRLKGTADRLDQTPNIRHAVTVRLIPGEIRSAANDIDRVTEIIRRFT